VAVGAADGGIRVFESVGSRGHVEGGRGAGVLSASAESELEGAEQVERTCVGETVAIDDEQEAVSGQTTDSVGAVSEAVAETAGNPDVKRTGNPGSEKGGKWRDMPGREKFTIAYSTRGHSQLINRIRWHPQAAQTYTNGSWGRVFATASDDGDIRVYNLAKGPPQLEPQEGALNSEQNADVLIGDAHAANSEQNADVLIGDVHAVVCMENVHQLAAAEGLGVQSETSCVSLDSNVKAQQDGRNLDGADSRNKNGTAAAAVSAGVEWCVLRGHKKSVTGLDWCPHNVRWLASSSFDFTGQVMIDATFVSGMY
jgi:hypothetical protein